MIDISEEYNVASLDRAMDALEAEERKLAVKKAIQNLPEEDGVLIQLHYLEELSLKEISEIVNVSVNTLKVRIFRARKRLADLLKNTLEPEIISSYGGK